ncbi:MAG: ABC transporter permease [Sandaracinaceae bacterium]
MRGTLTIFKREVGALFASPIAYTLLVAWSFITGLSFTYFCAIIAARPLSFDAQESPLTYLFGTTLLYIPIFIVVPVLTMRLIAEERSRGTLEVLLTAPVHEAAVVLGKYAAALFFWVVMLVPSLFLVWLTSVYGSVDLTAVAAAYLGLFGVGVYYLAIGTAVSAAAPNQIMSAVITGLLLVGLFLLGFGGYVKEEYREVFAYLSIWGHMEAFSRGIVDSRYVVFDMSVAVFALVTAVTVLSARRVGGSRGRTTTSDGEAVR